MAFSTSGALSGGASGAQAGAAFGPWGAVIGGVGGALAGGFGGGGGGSPKPVNPAGKIADKIIKRAFGKKRHQRAAAQFIRNRLPLSAGETTGMEVYNQLLAPRLGSTVEQLFSARDQLLPQLQRIAGGEMVMPDVDPYVKLAARTYQNLVAPQLAGQFAQDNAFFSDLHGNTSRRAAQDISTELAARALDLSPQATALSLNAIGQVPGFIAEPLGLGTGAVGSIFQTGLAGRTLEEGTRTGASPLVGSIFDPGGAFTGLANVPRLYDQPQEAGGLGAAGLGGLLG